MKATIFKINLSVIFSIADAPSTYSTKLSSPNMPTVFKGRSLLLGFLKVTKFTNGIRLSEEGSGSLPDYAVFGRPRMLQPKHCSFDRPFGQKRIQSHEKADIRQCLDQLLL